MRLAVSNIAWPKGEDDRYLPLLASLGVEGVEAAPGRLWADPSRATALDTLNWDIRLRKHRLTPVGFHALLYERPELHILDEACRVYLGHLAILCSTMGAPQMVLGSPQNRLVKGDPILYAMSAVWTLRVMAQLGWPYRVDLLFEPLAGADFIRTSEEWEVLYRAVAKDNFGLCLDTGALINTGEIKTARYNRAQHVHVNDPGNTMPGHCYDEEHKEISARLRGAGYDHWLTIEMREDPTDPMEAIKRGVGFVQATYLGR